MDHDGTVTVLSTPDEEWAPQDIINGSWICLETELVPITIIAAS